MFDNIKRFFKKNTRNNKQCPDIEIPGKIRKNKSSNNNKNNMDIVLIGGHYCTNETVKADVKQIVRVLGPDKNREGYYKLDTGKTISEYALLDEFTLLDTVPNIEKNRKKDLFRDFIPTAPVEEHEEEEDDTEPYSREIPEHLKVEHGPVRPVVTRPTTPRPTGAPGSQHYTKPTPEEEKYNDLTKLLERASISSLNANYEKKYGTKPYKEQEIELKINIRIPYEMNKLYQICELFDIQIKDVAEYLVSKLQLPKEEITEKLSDILLQSNIVKQSKPSVPVKQTEVLDTEKLNETSGNIFEEEELSTGINEVDAYLNKMFNK